MVASLRYEERNIIDAILQVQNTQVQMMQMLREVKEEICRFRETNANFDGCASNLDDIPVSISLISKLYKYLKSLYYITENFGFLH